jgi:hypothetical protein
VFWLLLLLLLVGWLVVGVLRAVQQDNLLRDVALFVVVSTQVHDRRPIKTTINKQSKYTLNNHLLFSFNASGLFRLLVNNIAQTKKSY